MTLQERARMAAEQAITAWESGEDGTPRGFRVHLADAMLALARETAQAIFVEQWNRLADRVSYELIRPFVDASVMPEHVAAALAAAESGPKPRTTGDDNGL